MLRALKALATTSLKAVASATGSVTFRTVANCPAKEWRRPSSLTPLLRTARPRPASKKGLLACASALASAAGRGAAMIVAWISAITSAGFSVAPPRR